MAKSSKNNTAKQRTSIKNKQAKADAAYKRQIDKLKKARAATNAKYRADLAVLSKIGAYNPKSKKLTKYRKTVINKTVRQFAEFMDPEKFFFLPIKAPTKTRRRVVRDAKEQNMITTAKGIFFGKDGMTSAKLTIKGGKASIHRKGWEKTSATGRKRKEDLIPIEPLDRLILQGRLEKMDKQLGPVDTKNGERFAFEIVETDTIGYSHMTYENIDDLYATLKEYIKRGVREKDPAKFMRQVKIVKTTAQTWREIHPPYVKPRRKRKSKSERKPRNV